MIRTTTACLLALAVVIPSVARGDHHESDNKSSADVWVTAIAPIGPSGTFAASTATGLLLRPSEVASFDPADPSAMTKLYEHPAAVWCVDSTDDGKTLVSVDYRGNLGVFDVASGKVELNEKAFERWCQSMLVSPDNQAVVAGNESGKVLVWSLADKKVQKSVELDGHSVTGLAFSPDNKMLAASDGGGHIHLLSWPELESKGKIEVSKETVWCVAFVDGENLLAGSSDRNLYRCPAKADAKAESIAKGSDWITELVVSSDGQVAAGEVGGRLHFPSSGGTDSMDAKSGVWALCWNGSGQLLAGTRKHGVVAAGRTWKWATPAPKPKPEPPAEKETSDDEKEAEETAEKKEESKPAEPKESEAKKEDKPAEEKPADEKPSDQPKQDKK